MKLKSRVVITGVGVVTPIGIGIEPFWNSLINGVSGVRIRPEFAHTNIPTRLAAQVLDFEFLFEGVLPTQRDLPLLQGHLLRFTSTRCPFRSLLHLPGFRAFPHGGPPIDQMALCPSAVHQSYPTDS